MIKRFLFLSITLWCTFSFGQVTNCNGLSAISIVSSNQCLNSSPVLKVSGAKFAAKIEWYKDGILDTTINLKTDNAIGVTVAGDANGTPGLDYNHLTTPWGVAVDPNNDSIYVTDYASHRVMKWKNGAGTLFAGQTSVHSQNSGYFYNPTGLFLSSTGSLYVSDYNNHKVQKFLAGSRTSTVIAGTTATAGSSIKSITNPFGVFVDKDSNVYVADAADAPIAAFNHNPTYGNHINKWPFQALTGTLVAGTLGVGGSAATELDYPTGVYVKTNGDIYIADFVNMRIQKWAVGANQGTTVADLSGLGTGGIGVFPSDIWVDENTNTMYITASNDIVDFPLSPFNNTDNYLLKWGAEGSTNYTILNTGTSVGNTLHTPSSLFLSPNGSIYVVDRANNRVQAWTKSIDTTFKPTTYGVYTAKIYNTGGCSVTSTAVVIDSTYSPAVSIAANPSGAICPGASVTFTATPKNGANNPSYQWKKNGTNVATGTTYTDNGLKNNDAITCILTSNNVCQSGSTASSNTITESVIANIAPTISIVSSRSNNAFCFGLNATFTASITNGGTNPVYKWMVNGKDSGTNSETFTSTFLNDKDIVTCQLTRTASGCVNTPVTSDTITVIINKATTASINKTVCSSYTWHGTTYITSGAYTFDSLNAKGCDSLTTLNLIVNQPTTASISKTACGSFTWHGTTYTASGAYTFDSLNAKGCDSLTTLNLIINQPTTASISKTACGSFTWHGTTYTASGAYTFDSLNAKGCDSLTTLNLIINQPTTVSISKTACGSFIWHGTTYTASGAYTFDSLNAKGCDSLTTLNLTINQPTIATITKTACSSYTWHGTTYTTSGTYNFDSLNAKGCDSLTTLNLTIKLPSTSTTNESITSGNSYNFNGTNYSTAGSYTVHLTNAVGCDSAATLILTVNNTTSSTTNESICAGGSYTFNGVTYTNPGIYTAHLINSVGVDSAATLVLKVNPLSTSTTNASICEGDSYTFNGTSYSTAGSYVVHLLNAASCDSAATLNLVVKQKSTSITNASFCLGGAYSFDGTTYNSAGSYTAHLINSVGCDSAALLILTAIPNVTPAINISASTTSICAGTPITFTATLTNEGSTPIYQWKVNNVNVGTNNALFTSSTLNNNDVVTCVLIANNPCQTANSVTSNSIKLTVANNLLPAISITASANAICSGTTVVFNGIVTNGGTSPILQWTKNGTNVGNNSATYIDASLINGDVITCQLTSNSTCVSQPNAVSNTYTAVVHANPIISTKNLSPDCGVTNIDLSTAISSNKGGLSFKYYIDAAMMNTATNPVTVAGSYYIKATNINGCNAEASVVVNNFKVTPVITAKANSTPCGVTFFDLKTAITSNTSGLIVAFYADATLSQLTANPVNNAGTYYVQVTNSDGCSSSTSIVVAPFQVLPTIAPIVGLSTLCKGQDALLTDKTNGGVWRSVNPNIAIIDGKGVVKGIDVGVATINYTVTNQCGPQVVTKYIYVSGIKPISSLSVDSTKNPDCIHPFFGEIAPIVVGNEGPYKYLLNYGEDSIVVPNASLNLGAGNYTINIYNANNCLVDSLKKDLVIEGNCDTVFMPTAFMPVSSLFGDQNKYLRPFGGSSSLIKSVHFVIFNRYGYKVYESKDTHMQGWDGRVNGMVQDLGTYIWELEYTTDTGTKKCTGYTVLIR